jgi:peptide/nickel transport system substrate-binding protein
MKRLFPLGLLTAALVASGGLSAQTLRWSSQGDPQTMDPHSQNESMTNMMNGQVYEGLVARDKKLGLTAALATEWTQVSPMLWRFKLRQGVKFHDGSPFTADDVVYSIERGQHQNSQISNYARAVGKPVKVDDYTVDFQLEKVNPVFLEHIAAPLWIMSKSWSEKNKVTKPLSFKDREETFASFNANGTGPYMLATRQPAIKTTYKRNPSWWGKHEGNVQEIVYTPIANDATRTAALISGEIDFVLDPPPRDVAKLRNTPGVKVVDGPENRIIFIGMDQHRDELLYGSVKDKNPFKDARVRKAFNQAVDVNAIVSKIMDGAAAARGSLIVRQMKGFAADLDQRPPLDPAAAKKLLAEAGYPDGFSVTLDCPNDRYVNDEAVCVAVAAMLGRIGVKVNVAAISKTKYFGKTLSRDTSFFLLGWGANTVDAHNPLAIVLGTPTPDGNGQWNMGAYSNPKLDEMTAQIRDEIDEAKRNALIHKAFKMVIDDYAIIPLFEPALVWATRKNVKLDQRADERFELRSVVKN